MMRDSTGVSPVIATILLIAITVVAVGVVMAFVAALPKATPPLNASISISNAVSGSTTLIISHTGGDPIRNAFNPSYLGYIWTNNWVNMEVRVNGAKVLATSVTLNNTSVTLGLKDFTTGDRLVLGVLYTPDGSATLSLHSGDVITVVYTPANQILVTVPVP
jgi:flagellin-like protein